MVKSKFSQVKIVENSGKPGFARVNNQGLALSESKYVLFLNLDTELLSNALDKMVEFLENEVDFGAGGCKLTAPDGSIQLSCARTFPPLNKLFEFFMFHRLFPHHEKLSTVELPYWDHRNNQEVDCLSGACILARGNIKGSVYNRERRFLAKRHKVRLRGIRRFSSERIFGELCVHLPKPMKAAARCALR